jgi:hypothetical protein
LGVRRGAALCGREEKEKRRKKEKEKRIRKKKKGKREGEGKLGKFWEKLGKIREKGKRDFVGILRIFGCRRNFWDGGDGEAGQPAGFAARAPRVREGEDDRGLEGG